MNDDMMQVATDGPSLKECQFFLVSYTRDGRVWEDEVAQHNYVPRVRQILGGRWERTAEYAPLITAYFNAERRVLVIGFPPARGWTLEKAQAQLQSIRDGREDLS